MHVTNAPVVMGELRWYFCLHPPRGTKDSLVAFLGKLHNITYFLALHLATVCQSMFDELTYLDRTQSTNCLD